MRLQIIECSNVARCASATPREQAFISAATIFELERGVLQMKRPDAVQGDYDAMMAATALEHDLIIVTRDIQDFEGMGIELLDPWL